MVFGIMVTCYIMRNRLFYDYCKLKPNINGVLTEFFPSAEENAGIDISEKV